MPRDKKRKHQKFHCPFCRVRLLHSGMGREMAQGFSLCLFLPFPVCCHSDDPNEWGTRLFHKGGGKRTAKQSGQVLWLRIYAIASAISRCPQASRLCDALTTGRKRIRQKQMGTLCRAGELLFVVTRVLSLSLLRKNRKKGFLFFGEVPSSKREEMHKYSQANQIFTITFKCWVLVRKMFGSDR